MTEPSLDRREVLGPLFPDAGEYLMVAGLAGSARDTAALTGEADTLFAFGGAMGGAVPMGLGMALAAPDRKVAVVTGDGELLMNAGALASVASTMPENLSIVCIDNGRHGETGGQPGHTARRTDLAKLAEGAGLPSTMTVADAGGLGAAAAFLKDAPGPRLVCVRVAPGPPADYRRNWDPAECRLRFRRAWREKSAPRQG